MCSVLIKIASDSVAYFLAPQNTYFSACSTAKIDSKSTYLSNNAFWWYRYCRYSYNELRENPEEDYYDDDYDDEYIIKSPVLSDCQKSTSAMIEMPGKCS